MTAKPKKAYNEQSISSLKGPDRVRRRPGVIFGSDGIEGCEHSFFEILSNSIDEAREGHGDKIIVTRYLDSSIEVEDFGRGIPMEYNEAEGRFNWDLIFCELYAGGKYDNEQGGSYEFSLGLNGLGLCATQYAARFMDVLVRSGGNEYKMRFEKGFPVGDLQKDPATRRQSGTRIRWMPDLDVFTEINIPPEYFTGVLKKQAVVNAGLTFIFRNETNEGFDIVEFCYPGGIRDYVTELSGDSGISSITYAEGERRGRDREDKPEYRLKLSVAWCFTTGVSVIEYYHNSSYLEHGGSPDKSVRSAFVSEVDAYLKQNSKYQKNESKVTFGDIADSLCIVTSSFSTYTSYENQTKKSINNRFIQEAMTEFLRERIKVYFIENPSDAEKIAEQMLINKRSRESAEKTRLNIKKKLSSGMDITNRVQKFVDCRTRDVSRRELYIVEGDSALGACKLGRDAEFQAIIPVRGKILNCLKAEYDKIFKNDIITDLIKVLGCGVEVKGKKAAELGNFDLSALRYKRVIICTDADVDGFQIRTLILTMLYRLTPTLIESGLVYIAESPLFEIVSKGKSYFAYTDKEKNDVLGKLGSAKFTVSRSKGLGENEPEMMWETTMNPKTRRLRRVIPEDASETARVFDMLLGDNLAARKEYIAAFGSQYLEAADI